MASKGPGAIPKRNVAVPARSKITVKKAKIEFISKREQDKQEREQRQQREKADENQKIDEVFAQSFEMAAAMLAAVPFKYQSTVKFWLKLLANESVLKGTRSSYLAALIYQIQSFKLMAPFTEPPPTDNQLEDAGKAFSAAKVKAMNKDMENKDRQDMLREALAPNNLPRFRTEFKQPFEFFDDQPMPKNGLVAYGGCFSNYFNK